MNQPVKPTAVVHLCWWIYPYRVPIMDEIYRRLGDQFIVVAHRIQETANNQMAAGQGIFPRLLLTGRHFELTRGNYDGHATPLGLTFTPGLVPALRRLRPQVIVSINFNAWTLTALALGYPLAIIWEGTAHTERSVKGWRRLLRRWMVRRTKAFIVNGALSRQYLVEDLGARPEDIFDGFQAPLPAPPRFRERPPRVRAPGDPVRFLAVGQLIKRKGPHHLIEAAAVLKRRLAGAAAFEIRLLGTGPERPALETLARERGLDSEVVFLGGIAPDAVWQHYAEADVFVLPTLQDNWPLVVPEAMFMSLPILLSRHAGSVPDLLQEGLNGFTFEPADHEQLASLMERYLRQPGLAAAQGGESRRLVARYTPQDMAEVFVRAAQHVAERAGRPLALRGLQAAGSPPTD
jgi:glycosyltransferase involved in cell wall biosynthesis